MNEKELEKLLNGIKAGKVCTDEAINRLRNLPFEDLGFAKIDHHRELRQGIPEIIFCMGKTRQQIIEIFKRLDNKKRNLLMTKAGSSLYGEIKKLNSKAEYNKDAGIIGVTNKPAKKKGKVLVMCAGTADIPVAEEAAFTADFMGCNVEKVYDVGVAGIHRLLSHKEKIFTADCVIAVAGMEGALPSVVGGLAPCIVIAVPTSVGYGASFKGITPLLTMMNSCTPNVVVVNIDNGFGAGYAASLIARK